MKKKYDWKNMDYKDYPYINLLAKQSQLKKYIKGRTDKLDIIEKEMMKLEKQKREHKKQIMIWNGDLKKVNRTIEQTTKIQKSDDSITLYKDKNRIRGSVRLYGEKKWIHIGSLNSHGVMNPNKKIGKMNDKELCNEFRYKLAVQVGKSKMRFFSDSYLAKRKKRKEEDKRLREEYRQKLKEGKITQVLGHDKTTDFKSSSTSKGMSKLQRKRHK